MVEADIKDYASAIEYTYDIPVNIYKSDTSDKVTQLNPNTMFERCMAVLHRAV